MVMCGMGTTLTADQDVPHFTVGLTRAPTTSPAAALSSSSFACLIGATLGGVGFGYFPGRKRETALER